MNAKEYLKGFYESHDEDSRLLSQSVGILPDSSQRDRADTGDRDVVKTAYLYLGRHLPAMNGQSPKSP